MEQIGFEVSAFYRVLPDTLDQRTVRWVLRQFEQVQAYQREQVHLQIALVEIGVSRAIVRTLGGDVPPLETGEQRVERWEKPAWMWKFEQANKSQG